MKDTVFSSNAYGTRASGETNIDDLARRNGAGAVITTGCFLPRTDPTLAISAADCSLKRAASPCAFSPSMRFWTRSLCSSKMKRASAAAFSP